MAIIAELPIMTASAPEPALGASTPERIPPAATREDLARHAAFIKAFTRGTDALMVGIPV